MIGETTPSVVNGSTALSFIGYALLSAFVTGPELLHREAELKLGWSQQCKQIVYEQLKDNQPRQETIPQINLGGLMDGLFGGGASTAFGDVIKPVQDVIDSSNQHARQIERMNEERLRRKAQASGSRCSCAVTMLTEHRVSLGLYAASGRLITPSIFRDLEASLRNTLRVQRCNQEG